MYKKKNIKLNTCSKKAIVVMILFCICCLSSHAQGMKNHLNKKLTAKVGAVYEETPDDNPCAGSEIYLSLFFDRKQVKVSEIEILTCGKESVYEIGNYNWELLYNKEISIDFIPEQTKGTYAEYLSLELRDKKLIACITHLNGKVVEYVFKEEK
ncbi:hypothetical protein [Aquimarina megaterium]|uniref:hypothetical protein n=1 Tax=Aquimarina megaterium TaxID=1443666 RepID=UPI000A50112F|nr:hypothetical protein [Aquimarina megaterium]